MKAELEGYHTDIFDNLFQTGETVEQTSNEFGRIKLVKNINCRGNLEGTITDAVSGAKLSNVSYKLFDGFRMISYGVTNTDGYYSISNAVCGSYIMKLSKSGYIDSSFTVQVAAESNQNNIGNNTMRKELVSGQMSIILTWDLDPRDLDSHLVKTNSSDSEVYHIYYSHKKDSITGDNLDLDDTSSYGPETVTIQNVDPDAKYVYSVYHYSGNGSIFSTSNAIVKVNYGAGEPITFRAPTSGNGAWWNVFEIINGHVFPYGASTETVRSIDNKYSVTSDSSGVPPYWFDTIENLMPPKQ